MAMQESMHGDAREAKQRCNEEAGRTHEHVHVIFLFCRADERDDCRQNPLSCMDNCTASLNTTTY